jgi:hypothetical protein
VSGVLRAETQVLVVADERLDPSEEEEREACERDWAS